MELLGWLRLSAIPAATAATRGVTLSKLVEVPGDADFAEQASSIALQIEFDTLKDEHDWAANSLPAVLADYTRVFGPQAVAFRTVLERLPL